MPTTLRIALLAGLLALLSNLAVIGFIYYRTHDEAVSQMRQQVVEADKVLTDVYRSGGEAALLDAVQDTIAYADPQAVVALFDRNGRERSGNIAGISQRHFTEGYRTTFVRLRGQPAPHQAVLIMHRLRSGQWLVSGRLSGEGLAIKQTLESSLLIALALAALLGSICGIILAHYVGARIGNIVAVARRISRHDLSRRVPLSGSGDAFDRLGQQINAMLDRISGLMEELRMLTDSLAHDLRSPVSRLRSAAQAAAESADPQEQEALLENVIRQADALMRILSAVLEISRSEALTGRKQFSWFDLGELGAELAEMYEPLAEEAGVDMEYERPARPVPVYGHRQLLAQAVSNLIENAVRYGAEGGEIRIDVKANGKQMRVEVADRGPGIPIELRGEALRRFGRLDSSRSKEGAGLGLAVAGAIAHLHDGELLLEDNGPGLLTALELPMRPSGAEDTDHR
ncbi:MAG TPA: ATP-binding protein [Sphingomicrobium sp.]|nr:ATP-binding protein [Sphingomicrobium sp.]